MTDPYQSCADICRALSDRTRLDILLVLRDGEKCACKILEHFHFSQPTLSYHMKILTGAGLVTSRKEGLWVHYSLCSDGMEQVIGILSSLTEKRPSVECNVTEEKR